MKRHKSYFGGGVRKILIVGDVSKAFLDVNDITNEHFEVCSNMLDAIETATKNEYCGIGIVMSGISGKLSAALRTLREHSDAKIILLAQMYEEPIAIRMMGSARNGTQAADDYLICPVEPDIFYETILSRKYEESAEPELSAEVDATIEMKIKHLEKLATEDDLTGLKNRRYIREFSRQIIERARKEKGKVTLLVFDIDDLKHYNDLYGHSAGDEVLKQVSVLMRRCCRSHDVVGRIGGDEFAVIFWDEPQMKTAGVSKKGAERRSAGADHPKEAISIAKRFVKELEKSELSSFGELGPEGKGVLTISGGLASFPRDGMTIEELFEQADKALLEAKRSGKNRIHIVGKPQSNNIGDID